MNTLSIIIPVFNEEKTVCNILEKIINTTLLYDFSKEIIIVNDCSTDSSKNLITSFIMKNESVMIRYFEHKKNEGKGAALHTGIAAATGKYTIIQDADLEYDPQEFNILLKPMVEGHADVVFGSRFMGGKPHRVLFFWHTIGNKFLTTLSNVFSNLNLTDMETCYKIFDTKKLQSLSLVEKRFGFEPEVTAKISKIPNIRIYEVGISYYGRTYDEGKKINWKDGFRAIYCIFKYGFLKL